MKIKVLPLIAPVLLLVGACNSPPTLTNLVATSGPEHTLVMVDGTNLLFSSVVWDAGLPTETVIPGGFLAGTMFSVPPAASLGAHPVALRNSVGDSAAINFDVTVPLPFGPPRIDRVSLYSATFSGANVEPVLHVQGANIDVGAIAQVAGVDIASAATLGLQNDLMGTSPTVLGYPIYHYLALLAAPGTQPAGGTLSITVRNLDGAVSAPFSYTLPASAAALDRDGDNLLDDWETAGYDANGDGVIDVDLPALGADPLRPDILVEVDVMNGLANPPVPSAGGALGTFETAQAMFAAAPLLNLTGTPGINLILDTSGTVPFSNTLSFGTILPGGPGTTDFATLKAANFDNSARDRIYHYSVWGNMLVGGYSGVSDVDFGGTESGDDFVVTFDDFSASYQTQRSQVETFVHELGHGLGQRHGGDTHSQYKPNYWSAMAYTWQLRSGQTDSWRRGKPTCSPIYWADATATEPNGAEPAAQSSVTDYSHGMAPTLVENNNSLDEPDGVCGVAVYWNGDLDTTDVNLSLDANGNGVATETLNDFSNWAAINFRGPEDDGDLTP
jgi:hypothetical protein